MLIVKIKIPSPTKFNSKEDLEKYGVYLIELGGWEKEVLEEAELKVINKVFEVKI